MSRPKKTLRNPHQLTAKQKLTINDMAQDVADGKGIRPSKSHAKFYNAKDKRNAEVLASQNLSKTNFQEGLIEALKNKEIIGSNGKLQQRLAEGLDATTTKPEITSRDEKGAPVYTYIKQRAYGIRLAYIKEINKITGVYAPTKIDQRSLTLRATVSPEQLDQKITDLQEELSQP